MKRSEIYISNYNYELPESRIAQYPLEQRDQSKLLVYTNGKIEENIFSSVSNLLTKGSLMIFNETRVIHARLFFKKKTGSNIEIFCLDPVAPSTDYQLAFASKSGVVWHCLIGNNKKWKQGRLSLDVNGIKLYAERLEQADDSFLIRFEWEPASKSFAEVMDAAGSIPLPPYISRSADLEDNLRYQTIFARQDGSVAAPTAGLHFTEKVFSAMSEKQIEKAFVTLHVGAGTFKPVSVDNVAEHQMHREFFSVSKETIIKIFENQNPLLAVGTTSVRTLESLYFCGKNLIEKKENPFEIMQWQPYEEGNSDIEIKLALQALLNFCVKNNVEAISGSTSMIIVPGYKYRIVNEMITNFHQPHSTLLLLVAAFIGDRWKEVYEYALMHDFRFLSYGDACYFKP